MHKCDAARAWNKEVGEMDNLKHHVRQELYLPVTMNQSNVNLSECLGPV